MISIREGTLDDTSAIAAVHVAAWQSTYRGLLPDEVLDTMSVERSAVMVQRMTTAGPAGSRVFVAEDAQAGVVGFAFAGPERDGAEPMMGEVYAIYLLDAMQGRGVGRRLMREAACMLSEELALSSLLVWVLHGNPARGFYERLGGIYLRDKEIVIRGHVAHEAAYVWDDLDSLVAALEQ